VAAIKKKNPSVPFGRRSLPSVPAFAPGWDAFYLTIFCALKRCLARTYERACRWSCGHQGKPSKLVKECQIFSTIEHSKTQIRCLIFSNPQIVLECRITVPRSGFLQARRTIRAR
jgi:hypothetical protein